MFSSSFVGDVSQAASTGMRPKVDDKWPPVLKSIITRGWAANPSEVRLSAPSPPAPPRPIAVT